MLGMFEYRVPHVWTNQFVLVKIITAWVNLGAAEDPLDIDDLYNMWLNLEWNETGFYGFSWILMDFVYPPRWHAQDLAAGFKHDHVQTNEWDHDESK